MSTYFKPGTWNCICDVCGMKFKSDEVRQRWDGFIVCAKDWEPRHPMDFMRTRGEQNNVTFTRPEPTDTFVGPSTSPEADIAQADIATLY